MNQSGTLTSPARQTTPPSVNPFARALAETENASTSTGDNAQTQDDPFAEALARSGGSFGDFQNPSAANGGLPDWWSPQKADELQAQQKEAKRQQEMAALRKKLHDRVNPVDQTDVFNAREAQVKKQIEELRKELNAMAQEIAAFHDEVEITLMTETVDPGQNGSYFLNFFHQLRQIIALLRQHIHSARTWANQAAAKGKKRPKRGGLLIQGNQAQQTTTVFDTMHHERSATYGGA